MKRGKRMADNDRKDFEKKVDEDWKKRAREEADSLERRTQRPGEAAGRGRAEEAETPASEEMLESLPPFVRLVSELAVQASIHLGFVENPTTGKKTKDLKAAQYVLDTLGMLEEKTKGNLAEAEAAYLEEVLYNLRMGFVKQAK